MLKKIGISAAIAACAALSFQSHVGAQGQRAAGPGRPTGGATTAAAGAAAYPTDEQWKDSKPAAALVAKAKAAAGTDPYLQERFAKMCTALGPQNVGTLLRNAGKTPEPPHQIEPVKIFDNLYFFGLNTIGAWAIPTSQGIILIDALNNPKEAETIIEPSLKKVGLNPADVKTIIVGHGHFDHFGGAPYFQEHYNAPVMMTAADWDLIARPPRGNANGAAATRVLPKGEALEYDHRAHNSAKNLLKPYNIEMKVNAARHSWEVDGLRLEVVLSGGSREECESWYVILKRADTSSSRQSASKPDLYWRPDPPNR
jgi:hypothetical protein